MESFLSRNRNLVVLLAVLLLQVIGLAVQVRKPSGAAANTGGLPHEKRDGGGVLLIRLWAASLVTPFEWTFHQAGLGLNGMWNEYVDLRHTREENKQLQQTVDRLRLEQAELHEDAMQGQRLQGLINFRQSYIYQTVPAQVIGTSGSQQSHLIYIDRGIADGLKPDMAVVSASGIVGKVRDVFQNSAQVLVINDPTSGAGVVLETTRIRGILRGNAFGQPQVINILADNRIQPGEHVLTAGGDQIFPRGLPVGVVERVERDPERGSFINVIVKPAANLQQLDEVLVITSLEPQLSAQQQADLKTSEELKGAEVAADAERKRAAAEMAERLPSLVDPNAPATPVADPKIGPDGKQGGLPSPPVVAPKATPALHPDRFSPGGGAVTSPGGDGAVEAPGAASPQPPAAKPATAKPSLPKPANPSTKPPQFAGKVK
jgi:rod shape-determining protein MreC